MLTFKEFKEQSALRSLPIREKFYRGMVFNVGELVEDTNGVYEILERGTNYVTVVNGCGSISKKSIDDIRITEGQINFATKNGFGFKGFVPSNLFFDNHEIVSEFKATIEKYNNGLIEDAIAIIKSIKAVDSLLETDNSDQRDIAYASLNRIGEWDHHAAYFDQLNINESMQPNSNDKLKIAGIIADTLGSSSKGSNAEMMVNNALRMAKHNNMTTNAQSLQIIQKMLKLADQVGIKYDTKILPSKIDEVSRQTVDSYLEKVKTNRPKTLNKVIPRFAGQERAQDRVHTDELKKIKDKLTTEATNPRLEDDVVQQKVAGETLGKNLEAGRDVDATAAPQPKTTSGTKRAEMIKRLKGV